MPGPLSSGAKEILLNHQACKDDHCSVLPRGTGSHAPEQLCGGTVSAPFITASGSCFTLRPYRHFNPRTHQPQRLRCSEMPTGSARVPREKPPRDPEAGPGHKEGEQRVQRPGRTGKGRRRKRGKNLLAQTADRKRLRMRGGNPVIGRM